MSRPLRVAVITNMITTYRRDYFRRIFDDPDLAVTVFCQDGIPGMNLPPIHREFGERVVEVPYVGADRELIGWQRLPWRQLLSGFDVYFVHGNPRVLSNVAVSLLLRLTGKRVVIEGQLHTAGSRRLFEEVRLLWWRLFRYVYLYNEVEISSLRAKRGFSKAVAVGMNNGLDQSAIEAAQMQWPESELRPWQHAQGITDRTVLLSCARLEAKNRFELMLDCLPELKRQHPDILWCVIGAGPLRTELEQRFTQAGLSDSVRWLGALYEEAKLAPWFLSARTLVHPGAVGLSLLHAFGYGLPVVTHAERDQHMPEFAALTPGENGLVYPAQDPDAMTAAILEAIEKRGRLGIAAKQTAQTRFNTRVMAERFKAMCQLAAQTTNSNGGAACA